MLPTGLPGWNGSSGPAARAVIRCRRRLQRHPSSATAATAGQLVGQLADAIDGLRIQRDARALYRKETGPSPRQPGARARDDDDDSLDVVAHGLDSCLP